jgi:hypothetical protein
MIISSDPKRLPSKKVLRTGKFSNGSRRKKIFKQVKLYNCKLDNNFETYARLSTKTAYIITVRCYYTPRNTVVYVVYTVPVCIFLCIIFKFKIYKIEYRKYI